MKINLNKNNNKKISLYVFAAIISQNWKKGKLNVVSKWHFQNKQKELFLQSW